MNDFQKALMLGITQGVSSYKDAPLSLTQATKVIDNMIGQYRLMSVVMLNCGLHPKECVNLRVRHFCREKHKIIVPSAAGFNIRSSFVPIRVYDALIEHIEYLGQLHADDLCYGFGQVRLPESFANTDGRYSSDLEWQWLFSRRSLSLETGGIHREQQILEILQRRINQAAKFLRNADFLHETELEVDVFWRSYLAGISD